MSTTVNWNFHEPQEEMELETEESAYFAIDHLTNLQDSLTTQDVVCGGTVEIKAPESELRLFFKNPRDGMDGAACFLQLPTSSPEALEPLLAACSPASFGMNNQDVLDPTYRNALRLNTSDFAINFSPERLGILKQIEDRLVGDEIDEDDIDQDRSGKQMIFAEMYKLNVYATGGFFKEHKDTPRARNMFGSLVVCLPTAHTGGELILKEENGRKHTYNWSQDAPISTCHWVAFYSETTHEILPVTSGHRLTLTYNLYFEETHTPALTSLSSPPSDSTSISPSLQDPTITNHPFYKTLSNYLLNDPTFLPNSGLIVFHLENSYPIPDYELSPSYSYLKGSDRMVYCIAKSLGLNPHVKAKLAIRSSGYDMTVLTSNPGGVKGFSVVSAKNILLNKIFSNLVVSNGDMVIGPSTTDDEELYEKCKRGELSFINNIVLPWSHVVWLNNNPLTGDAEDEDRVCSSAMLAIEKELAMSNLTSKEERQLMILRYQMIETRYSRVRERKGNPCPKDTWGTHIEQPYIAYGNEYSIDYIYGSGVLVIYVGSWDKKERKRKRGVVFPYAE